MQISVTDAKAQLTELVRRAEKGEGIILTRHGHATVKLVPVKAPPEAKSRRALVEAARKAGTAKATTGPSAARSQDFLYGRPLHERQNCDSFCRWVCEGGSRCHCGGLAS